MQSRQSGQLTDLTSTRVHNNLTTVHRRWLSLFTSIRALDTTDDATWHTSPNQLFKEAASPRPQTRSGYVSGTRGLCCLTLHCWQNSIARITLCLSEGFGTHGLVEETTRSPVYSVHNPVWNQHSAQNTRTLTQTWRQRAGQMNRLNDRGRPVGGAQTLCGRPAAAITNPTGWTVLPLSRFPRYYSLPVAPSRLKCNTVSVVAQLITVDSDNFIVIALSTMMYCVHCL